MDTSKFKEMKISNGAIACPTDELQDFVCCLIYSANEGKIDHAVGCTIPPTASNMLEILGFMGDKYPTSYGMVIYLLPRSQMMKTSTVYEINNTTGQAKVMLDSQAPPDRQIEGVMKMVATEALEFSIGARMVADIFMNSGLRMIGNGGCNDPECLNCRLINAACQLIPIEKRPVRVSAEQANLLMRDGDQMGSQDDMLDLFRTKGTNKDTMH
jgi:hypothetical protein